MSYYIPLPGLDDAGLGKVWDGLDVVSQIVTENGNFHIAAPMEFRFVKGGDSAMSGTFTEDPEHTWFVNLDLIGFVEGIKWRPIIPPHFCSFSPTSSGSGSKWVAFHITAKCMVSTTRPRLRVLIQRRTVQPELSGQPPETPRRTPGSLQRLPQKPRSERPLLQRISAQFAGIVDEGRIGSIHGFHCPVQLPCTFPEQSHQGKTFIVRFAKVQQRSVAQHFELEHDFRGARGR